MLFQVSPPFLNSIVELKAEEVVEVKAEEVVEVKAEEVDKVKAEESVQNVVSDVSADATEEVVEVQVENDTKQAAFENVVQVNEVGNETNPDTIKSEQLDKILSAKNEPEEAIVHAEVSFGNSPNSSLSQADLKSLEGLIFRQNHMKENIRKMEYGKYFSNRVKNQTFKHTIEIKLSVNTKKLWENARSYIWRHFGQDEWTSKDGTLLTSR